LGLARNRDLHTAGPTIAVALCIGTLAVLTLTPVLMTLVGRVLFWPVSSKPQPENRPDADEREGGRLWSMVARFVTRRPGTCTALTLMVLLPTAIISGISLTRKMSRR
jgi:uncharacterized membrane protein YdfJ with MMPL/SSD domain